MTDVLVAVSDWISPYLQQVAMTIIATLLVVYGDVINKHIKRALNPYHFVVRTGAFVLICAFGYGALVVFATPKLADVLRMLPYAYLGISVISIFLVIGYLAENRRYI